MKSYLLHVHTAMLALFLLLFTVSTVHAQPRPNDDAAPAAGVTTEGEGDRISTGPKEQTADNDKTDESGSTDDSGTAALLQAGCKNFGGKIVCCSQNGEKNLTCEAPSIWPEEHPLHAAIAAGIALLIALISIPFLSRGERQLNRTTSVVLSIAILAMAAILISITMDNGKKELGAAAFSVLGTLAGFTASRSFGSDKDDNPQSLPPPKHSASTGASGGQDTQTPASAASSPGDITTTSADSNQLQGKLQQAEEELKNAQDQIRKLQGQLDSGKKP